MSPGQQLLEVVKTWDTKAASAEVPLTGKKKKSATPVSSWKLVSFFWNQEKWDPGEGVAPWKASLFRAGPEHDINPMVLSPSTKR